MYRSGGRAPPLYNIQHSKQIAAGPSGRVKAKVCGRSPAEIVGSNPAGSVGVFCECCVFSGRGLYEEPITRPASPIDCGAWLCVI
jgi:hypothetical protein